MTLQYKDIEQQFIGYVNTPTLWVSNSVYGLKQFELGKNDTPKFTDKIPTNLRLGKRVERYVSTDFKQSKDITILAENLQIQNNKLTIGEIDCILIKNKIAYHIEIIYKFYLFDDTVGSTELDYWIGPNRNDSLIKKLDKLKDKQLPLLCNTHTTPIIKKLNLSLNKIKQRVFFKAQLFTPYKRSVKFKQLNKNCVKGFYVKHAQLEQFNKCKFYIPNKTNWLQEVKTQVNWLAYNTFTAEVNTLITAKKSPLCWIKFPNGELEKFFVVWW